MPVRYNYTEDELIQMYIEFSKKLGKKDGASSKDFIKKAKEYDMPSYGYYMNFFDGLANLKKKTRYVDKELLNTDVGLEHKIREFYAKNKRYPVQKDFQYKNGLLPMFKIKERYGNIKNMYKKLNINDFVSPYRYLESKNREEILSDIADIIKKHKLKSWQDFVRLKLIPSSKVYIRALNSNGSDIYNEAMGIKVIKDFSEKELIEKYIRISNELNNKNGATIAEFKKHANKHNVPKYWRYAEMFGSIEKLREKAGFIIQYDDDYFRNKIEDFVRVHERYPKLSDCFNDVKFIRNNIVKNRYGNLKKMYEALDINLFASRKLALQKDDELIFEEVSEIIIKNNIKTMAEFKKLKLDATLQGYLYRLNMTWLELYNKVTMSDKKLEYTKEEIIIKYEKVKKHIQKSIPRIEDFKDYDISVFQFTKLWGSYSNFIKEYEGEDITMKTFTFTDEELIKMYRDFSDYIGNNEGASGNEMSGGAVKYGIPSMNYYNKRFSTIHNLKLKAGYIPRESQSKYSRQYIIDRLYKAYRKYGRPLTKDELKREKGLPSHSTISNYIHQTSIKKIWEIVLSEKGIKQQ